MSDSDSGPSLQASGWRMRWTRLRRLPSGGAKIDRGQDALVTQVHAFGADRARLASELDHAAALSRGLQTTTREVARRVDQAIELIRSVLAEK